MSCVKSLGGKTKYIKVTCSFLIGCLSRAEFGNQATNNQGEGRRVGTGWNFSGQGGWG